MSGPQLDTEAVREAYRRWAGIYDTTFGLVARAGRRRAAALANGLPGRRVLEVGVGTGLSLPLYRGDKRVTGIDLSAAMLTRARARVSRLGLRQVEGLHEMDAEATRFADASFDIAVAMFVASVVPRPRTLLAELQRIVQPRGHILFVNHFSAAGGVRRRLEHMMAPAARALGWHPDFPMASLLPPELQAAARCEPVPPAGLFTLVHLDRTLDPAWGHAAGAS